MLKSRSSAANSAIIGIYTLLICFFAVLALYLGQVILKPIVTALLLAFLLTPIVSKIERWLGRIISILIVVLFLLLTSGIVAYVFSRQVVDFVDQLPVYQTNVTTKLNAWQDSENATITRVWQVVGKITENIKPPTQHLQAPLKVTPKSLDTTQQVVTQKVIEGAWSLTAFIPVIFGSVFNFFASTFLVFILLFFMLFKREELRGKSIHLMGKDRIGVAALAIDEAGNRVLHYLLRLSLVNLSYGFLITIGLYLIGIPNAALWGGMACVFRFLPYIGAWLVAIIPIILSLIISNNWILPFETISLFLVLEIVIGNIIEPVFYGAGVKVSSLALIIAAIFWTWLWGAMGLILAIPLTVCIVVLGRYIPRLAFLSALMSNEQPLELYQQCYYRLISGDLNDALILMDSYLKDHSMAALYDHVMIPVIREAEYEFRDGELDFEQREFLYQNIRDVIEELETRVDHSNTSLTELTVGVMDKMLCLPLRFERDELAAIMLVQLFNKTFIDALFIPLKQLTENFSEIVKDQSYSTIFISVAPVSSLLPVRYLCTKFKMKRVGLKIIVGLWGLGEVSQETRNKLQSAGVDQIVLSFEEALSFSQTQLPSK